MKELKFPFHLEELKQLDETIMKLGELNPWALFGFFASLYISYAGKLYHLYQTTFFSNEY